MIRSCWILLGLSVGASLSASGCAPGPPPEDLGAIHTNFDLVERTGNPFRPINVARKVWIASFIFTRCSGPCNQVTGHMAWLQEQAKTIDDLKLVSFTVDPEYDTPEVLREYAERHGADRGRWWFVTGNPKEIYKVIRDDFHLTAKPNEGADRTPGNEIMHDNRLVVVDRHGHIRGYFDGTKPEEVQKALATAKRLVREES